jgi:hypothetical protein
VSPGCSLFDSLQQDDQTPTSQEHEEQRATGVASVTIDLLTLLLHPDVYDWDRVLSF